MGGSENVVRFPRALQVLVAGAALVIVVTGIREAASILSSFLMALVITIGIAPLPGRFARRGLPMWLALVLTVLIALIFIVGLVLLLGGALVQFAGALPTYTDGLRDLSESIDSLVGMAGLDLADINITEYLDPVRIGSYAAGFISSLLDALSNTSLLLLLVLFMLLDSVGFSQKMDAALGVKSRTRAAWHRFALDTRKYLVITAWTGALVGAVNAILLAVLGVDFPLLWGVLAFLFSFIPNIGFLLSMIPPAMLALLELGWGSAVIVVVGYVVINAGVDNVLKPKVIGDDLDLSLATTFISLVFWGWALGPLGAILAVPLTLLVKHVLLDGGDDSRWLGQLMALRPAATKGGSE